MSSAKALGRGLTLNMHSRKAARSLAARGCKAFVGGWLSWPCHVQSPRRLSGTDLSVSWGLWRHHQWGTADGKASQEALLADIWKVCSRMCESNL